MKIMMVTCCVMDRLFQTCRTAGPLRAKTFYCSLEVRKCFFFLFFFCRSSFSVVLLSNTANLLCVYLIWSCICPKRWAHRAETDWMHVLRMNPLHMMDRGQTHIFLLLFAACDWSHTWKVELWWVWGEGRKAEGSETIKRKVSLHTVWGSGVTLVGGWIKTGQWLHRILQKGFESTCSLSAEEVYGFSGWNSSVLSNQPINHSWTCSACWDSH